MPSPARKLNQSLVHKYVPNNIMMTLSTGFICPALIFRINAL
jgi:hypothetical protein